MRFTSFEGLRDWRREALFQAYLNAQHRGWLSPCHICWPDPDGYARKGHVCDVEHRRNHSTNNNPSAGHVVAFRAVQSRAMDDEEIERHNNRKVRIYGGYKWR